MKLKNIGGSLGGILGAAGLVAYIRHVVDLGDKLSRSRGTNRFDRRSVGRSSPARRASRKFDRDICPRGFDRTKESWPTERRVARLLKRVLEPLA